MEIAPVTMAVPWPGASSGAEGAAGCSVCCGCGGCCCSVEVVAGGVSLDSALHMWWCCLRVRGDAGVALAAIETLDRTGLAELTVWHRCKDIWTLMAMVVVVVVMEGVRVINLLRLRPSVVAISNDIPERH